MRDGRGGPQGRHRAAARPHRSVAGLDVLVPTEIVTDRLLLRLPVADDAEALEPVFGDPQVVRYLGGDVADRHRLWRAVAEWLGHWHLRGYGMWTWVDRASGAVVGRGGLWNPSGWPHLEVGWTLGRVHWGRGYATEAGRAALETAWTHLDADWVCSVIHPGNVASQRVAQRLGGRFDRHAELGGTPVDIWRYDRPAGRPPGSFSGR